jgi:hypothetical protein
MIMTCKCKNIHHSALKIFVSYSYEYFVLQHALEYLDTGLDIDRAWEAIREDIKISVKESLGYYELRKHEP